MSSQHTTMTSYSTPASAWTLTLTCMLALVLPLASAATVRGRPCTLCPRRLRFASHTCVCCDGGGGLVCACARVCVEGVCVCVCVCVCVGGGMNASMHLACVGNAVFISEHVYNHAPLSPSNTHTHTNARAHTHCQFHRARTHACTHACTHMSNHTPTPYHTTRPPRTQDVPVTTAISLTTNTPTTTSADQSAVSSCTHALATLGGVTTETDNTPSTLPGISKNLRVVQTPCMLNSKRVLVGWNPRHQRCWDPIIKMISHK